MEAFDGPLYSQVRQRMVESGEWERIQQLMAFKLNESGWSDELRHRAKEKARAMSPLSFRILLEELSQHSQTSMPLAVKKEIMTLVRQYLDQQLEK